MPWEVTIVTELRTAFVNQVVARKQPVSEACRQFGISRKTGYKWLARYRKDAAVPLANQSRTSWSNGCWRRAASSIGEPGKSAPT